MASHTPNADLLVKGRMRDAIAGDAGACFDLGVANSAGTGARINLIEAHKWFSLAAIAGYELAEPCRANAAWRMTARELAEARRRVRLAQRSPIWQAARLCASAFV